MIDDFGLLIVDLGKGRAGAAPLLARHSFNEAWAQFIPAKRSDDGLVRRVAVRMRGGEKAKSKARSICFFLCISRSGDKWAGRGGPALPFFNWDCGLGRGGAGFGAQMTLLKTILRDRRFHRLAGVLLVLGGGAVLVAWRMGVDFQVLKGWWKVAEGFLMDRPWLLFAGLVVLPGLPVPTSALLFLAGTVWRDRPVMACGICLLALALNMTWTYWAAAKPGRGLVEKLLVSGRFRIPEMPHGNHLRFILLLRLTPGFPLFLQNYLLGFFRVPFRLYLLVSMGCSGLIACGVVLSGAGVADGNLTPVISGVALIAVGYVAVRWVRAEMGKKTLDLKTQDTREEI